MGNYKDAMMEQLADKGNGNNYYIDSFEMAKRVFAEQLDVDARGRREGRQAPGRLRPGAWSSRYRLIGYENRDLKDSDFRKDDVGAGQVGWGHQVTALYEVELAEARRRTARHGPRSATRRPTATPRPRPRSRCPPRRPPTSFRPRRDLRFAFAVAAFADVMRGATTWPLEDIRALADANATNNDRKELVGLIDRAMKLRGNAATVAQ